MNSPNETRYFYQDRESHEIVARREQLQSLIAGMQEAPVLLHPTMALRYQEKVNALVQSLADERHRHQAIELIRGLIDKVVLSPNSKGQELVIDVYGDLAGILNISTDIDCGSLRQEIDFKQIRMIVGLDLPVSGSPQAPDDQPTPKWG